MYLTRIAFPRLATGLLLSCLVAGGTAAYGEGAVENPRAELVTYEVAPKYIVTREIAPDEIVVKEITREEVVKEIAAPQVVISRRARKVAPSPPAVRVRAEAADVPDLATFLDRLMMAESGGRDMAANPRSSAIGPFQFIKSTFIDVVRRNFPREVAELDDEQLLELRTSRNFARAAAAAFTSENAAQLKTQGVEPTLAHLRLAFLLGASGAARVVQAQPQQRLSDVLGPAVLRANPFMVGMTASGLVAKAARDIYGRAHVAATDADSAVARPDARARPEARRRPGSPAVAAKARGPAAVAMNMKCSPKLTTCRRWIALQQQRQLKPRKTRDALSTTGRGKGA